MENFENLLIFKRKELGLSLRDAAKLMGISHTYLNVLEKGADPRNNAPASPTPDTLRRISEAYKISYKKLMTDFGYLSEKNEKDIQKRIEELRKDLLSDIEGLNLGGDPLSPEAAEIIIGALSIGLHEARILNRKYLSKK
ncbi:MAG: helix-turn-helix transcriptional regulator [Clostridiaceae bacterium]